MAIHTDNPQFAATFLPPKLADGFAPAMARDPLLAPLTTQLFDEEKEIFSAPGTDLPWPHLFISEFSSGSQYDRLIEMARAESELPDGVACLAGSGTGFHGFKGRSWSAEPGNIHLAVHLAPRQEMAQFQIAFTILAALSVVDALDQIGGLREEARIKWVNDILLGGKKVGGVLAYTQTHGTTVGSAVLGIGVNLEVAPQVEPTPFVPQVSSVWDFLSEEDPTIRATFFGNLLRTLEGNYRELLEDGFSSLMERYRDRSMVVGKDVTVCTESSDQTLHTVAQGRVLGIGENLELILEGRPNPITGGRLILGRIEGQIRNLAEGEGEGDLAPLAAKYVDQ